MANFLSNVVQIIGDFLKMAILKIALLKYKLQLLFLGATYGEKWATLGLN